MPSASFDSLVPHADGHQAAQFYDDWFGEEREKFSVVTRITPGGSGVVKNMHHTPVELRDMFRVADMDELIYADDMRWNLYMGVGVMGKKPQGPTGRRKGGKKDITYVPGVWIDLDVDKDDAFRDEEHALDLLRYIDPLPTIVVATGTGGVHGYWKTAQPLNPEHAEELTEMWWAHLERESQSKIDKLTNCDRIMKLPGSIRWAKEQGDEPKPVRLLYSTKGTVLASTLEAKSTAAWGDYKTKIQERKLSHRKSRDSALDIVGLKKGGWNRLMALTSLEDEFNDTHTWEDILLPHGWTQIGHDGEGRTLWARPGVDPSKLRKAAATDFGDSQAMSLFSDSPETGLLNLHEAEVPLTKYRVHVELNWNGNEAEFVRTQLGLE